MKKRTLTRNEPNQTPAQARYPSRSMAASAIPEGGHTTVTLPGEIAAKNPNCAVAIYTIAIASVSTKCLPIFAMTMSYDVTMQILNASMLPSWLDRQQVCHRPLENPNRLAPSEPIPQDPLHLCRTQSCRSAVRLPRSARTCRSPGLRHRVAGFGNEAWSCRRRPPPRLRRIGFGRGPTYPEWLCRVTASSAKSAFHRV